MSLELVSFDCSAEFVQPVIFLWCANSARVELCAGKFERDDRHARTGSVEEMQIQTAREFIANAYPPHAITARIERRRKNSDAKLAGQDRDDPARHSALGGHADFVNPFSSEIIHPAGTHYAKNALDVLAADGLFAGEWIAAAIG